MSLEELLRACAEVGNEDVWQEFVACFQRLIAGVVLKTARRWGDVSPDTVEDLVQETYLKLCSDPQRMLAEFDAHHQDAFYGYLKVVTANLVNDYFRARHSKKRNVAIESSLQELNEEIADCGLGSAKQIERAALLAQVDAVLPALAGTDSERDRTIFWLYWRHGMTAQAIAEMPGLGLTAKGVESVIYRLTRLVRQRLAEQRCSLEAS